MTRCSSCNQTIPFGGVKAKDRTFCSEACRTIGLARIERGEPPESSGCLGFLLLILALPRALSGDINRRRYREKADKLNALADARHNGLITDEEFESKRNELLGDQSGEVSAPLIPEFVEIRATEIPEQIRKLAELRDAGILSEVEFAEKKAQLLNRM